MSVSQTLMNNPTLHIVTVNNINNTTNTDVFKVLFEHICVDAYTKSGIYDHMKCHEGTRKLILERLENWVAAPGNADRLITWLDGPMGSGKTSVAVTIAERVSAKNKLIGSFIFRRGQPGRNEETRFVATLAYQMALSIPLVRPFIEERISHDHSILQQSLSHQLDALILKPLCQMRSQHPEIDVGTLPHLIIVDGLDECGPDKKDGEGDGEEQQRGKEEQQLGVLELLHRLTLAQDVLPFAILVHSRPEIHIHHWFSMDQHASITNRFTLDSSYNPKEDIRLFVTHGLLNLLETHPFCLHLRGTRWPYEVQITDRWGEQEVVNSIDLLVERSEGLFIYAAIGMGFISSKRHPPSERLLQILERHPAVDNSPTSPYTTMDALYTQILDSISNPQVVQRILVLDLLMGRRHVPQTDALLIQLSVLSISRHDFDYFLQQSASILSPGTERMLVFQHSSLGEFLNSRGRSQHWYMVNYLYKSAHDIALNAFKSFSRESSVNAQLSYLDIIMATVRDGSTCINGWEAWQLLALVKEFKGFCDFLNSSYHAAVMRLLTSDSLSTFLNKIFYMFDSLQYTWANTNYKKWISKFWSHIKTLIKPHVKPYWKNPRTFAVLLCRLFDIPASNTDYVEDILSPPTCPFTLRELFRITVTGPYPNKQEWLAYVFSIRDFDFLCQAVTILLKHAGQPSVMFCLRSIDDIIDILHRNFELSQGLWLSILDCDEYFTPYLHRRLHHKYFAQNLQRNPLSFRCLHYQHQYCPNPILPFEIALGKCYWEPPNNIHDKYGGFWEPPVDVYDIRSDRLWFIEESAYSCRQIVVPSVPPLACYTVYCYSAKEVIQVPNLKYEASCRCGRYACLDSLDPSLDN